MRPPRFFASLFRLLPAAAGLACLAAGVSCRDDRQAALARLEKSGHKADFASLGAAVASGDRETVRLIIAAGLPATGLKQVPVSLAAEAAAAGNWEMLSDLLPLTTAKELNAPLADGRSMLEHAHAAGQRNLALDLLQRGADPSRGSDGGLPLIRHVLGSEDPEFSGALIERLPPRGAPIDTALLISLAKKDTAMASRLLARGASPSARNEADQTALVIAAGTGDASLVRLLLEYGAGAEEATRALAASVKSGSAALGELLLQAGADPEEGGSESPLAAAVAAGNQEMVRLMFKHGARPEQFADAAISEGNSTLLALLFDNGLSPDRPGSDGNPPLVTAALNSKPDFAAFLLDHGANPMVTGAEGQSAFHIAAAAKDLAVMTVLLDHGVPADAPFASPPSAEFLTRVANPVFEKWLKRDADLTPMMLSAARGDTGMVRFLLDRGAKRGTQSKNWKRFAIMFACEAEQIAAAQLLLGRNPESDKRNVRAVISLAKQRVTVYKDEEVIRTVRCSTGRKGYDTPPGRFVISDKQANWISSIYDVPMPHFMRLSCRDIGLHAGVVPGYPASHGCIRIPKGDAASLYGLMKIGDPVTIEQ